MKKALIGLVILAMVGPFLPILLIGLVMSPAANATCTIDSLALGTIPDSLHVTTSDGTTVTLDKAQLTHAATIITVGTRTTGAGRDGITVALMAALTESSMRMLSNPTYSDSTTYPNDGSGSDHDSLGMFQMRPHAGWGTVKNLMDPTYQARAFFGGPTGPNYPSPRGLLDIPDWQTLPKGAAAQSVEVSAYPDRYARWEPAADTIITALTAPSNTTPATASSATPGFLPPVVPGLTLPSASSSASSSPASTVTVVFPLPAGSWVKTSPFEMRTNPVTGVYTLHAGTDYAAPDGTPIMAVADGTVTFAGASPGFGQAIKIDHVIDGQPVTSVYGHMWPGHLYVKAGDHVTAGQHIADVGSNGNSTGPHLHFEIHPNGGAPVDSDIWLKTHMTGQLPAPDVNSNGCYTSGSQQ